MPRARRERLTIDLRGLAPVLKEHAKARRLTVSDAARLALAAAIESAPASQGVDPSGAAEGDAQQRIKLTIRLQRSVADRLTTRAHDCGLSHGAYLTTLIDGTPAPPLAAVTALNASTDQLAVVSADLNEVIRLLRDRSLPAAKEVDEFTRRILEALRKHLDLASRVVADVRPARAHPTRRSIRGAGEPLQGNNTLGQLGTGSSAAIPGSRWSRRRQEGLGAERPLQVGVSPLAERQQRAQWIAPCQAPDQRTDHPVARASDCLAGNTTAGSNDRATRLRSS